MLKDLDYLALCCSESLKSIVRTYEVTNGVSLEPRSSRAKMAVRGGLELVARQDATSQHSQANAILTNLDLGARPQIDLEIVLSVSTSAM